MAVTVPETQAERDTMNAEEIIELVMTQHWDIAACMCWICREGRATGCHARPSHLEAARKRQPVDVPQETER